jgi:hypothetical protein
MPTREQIYQALANLTTEVVWGAGKVFLNQVATRRRVKLFSDASIQPAIYQAEHEEEVAQITNLPYKRVFKASWIVYQNTGKDHKSVPAVENNLILDAIQVVIEPKPADPGFSSRRNTLGGLVHHCYIDGDVFKDPGDIDDQGMMVIPITMLVP